MKNNLLYSNSRSSKSRKIIQSYLIEWRLKRIITKSIFPIIFPASPRRLDLLSNTQVLMCPRQVLPGPVFLGADGRFFFLAYVATWTDDTNQPLGYCILSISYRVFSIRISDIIFFRRIISWWYQRRIYEIANSKLQLTFHGFAVFDKLQNLLGSSSQASIHALDWIFCEQTINDNRSRSQKK